MKQWWAIAVIFVSACGQAFLPVPPHPDSNRSVHDRFPHTEHDSSPLDRAVMSDRVDDVRRLLEAGADPNVRCCGGDKFALQEAFRDWAPPITHRVEIVRLLLAHGADPNMRWCPFETRTFPGERPGCVNARAWTALIGAAYLDSPEIVEMLLDAGADPWPRDWAGAAAIDYASSEQVMQRLARAHFPDEAGRAEKTLQLLNEFAGNASSPIPWNDTALSRALIPGGSHGYVSAPPPPPPPGVDDDHYAQDHIYFTRVPGRVKALLTLGADPNERITLGGADWPPLAMAVQVRASRAIDHLLDHHADVDTRFCVPIDWRPIAFARRPEPGCTRANGFTPLMWAARVGAVDSAALLIRRGADASLKDWAGRTARDHASSRGMRDLLAAGRRVR
jgi:ankyrin repeat protein